MTPSCVTLTVYVRGVPLKTLFLSISRLLLETSVILIFPAPRCLSVCPSAVFLDLRTLNTLFLYSNSFSVLLLHLIFCPSHALSPSSAYSLSPLLLSFLPLPRSQDDNTFDCILINFLSLGRSTPAAQTRRFLSSQEKEDLEGFMRAELL